MNRELESRINKLRGQVQALSIAATLAVAILSCVPLVSAQTASTGALSGKVTDPTGAVVPGVAITATNASTGEKRTVISQDNGAYGIPQLPPGTYQIEVGKSGFKRATSSSIPINVTETTTFDISLEIGEMSETVTVTSEATVTQTESSALGRVVGERVVSNLPLVTRNYTQILALSIVSGFGTATPPLRFEVPWRSLICTPLS